MASALLRPTAQLGGSLASPGLRSHPIQSASAYLGTREQEMAGLGVTGNPQPPYDVPR